MKLKGRHLALFAVVPALTQCQPACTPTPPGPPPPTYTYEPAAYCDEDFLGVEIHNTGTGNLWVEGDTEATPPDYYVDIDWPPDPTDPTYAADSMTVVIHQDTATGAVVGTETYSIEDVCGAP